MTSENNAQRTYRAIFFDLDGTLLPMDMDEFLERYYHALGAYVAEHGLDPHAFAEGLNAGVNAMLMHDDGAVNAHAFWDTFLRYFDEDAFDWQTLLDGYYNTRFGEIGNGCEADPAAAQALETLHDKGYPLVLATMPLFPRRALEWRLDWAQVDPAVFARMTDYENSTAAKPKLAYYEENLKACGLRGEDVLMVGNNTLEDYAITKLGADIYIVTDHLLDPAHLDLSTVKHGTLAEFAQWAQTLPPCENPAPSIEAGRVR